MTSRYNCQKINFKHQINKVVVRRLPPNFTLETFKRQVHPLPLYNYIYFVEADKNYGPNAFSRAYINFLRTPDVFLFKEKYDNYVFIGPKGKSN